MRTLLIAGAIVAFLIGPGFSTGQEIMQFFVAYGINGLLATLLVFLLLSYLGLTLLSACQTYELKTNQAVYQHYCGQWLGNLLTIYTNILIFAVYGVMLAAADAVLNQSFGIPSGLGSGVMALLTLATIILGLERFVRLLGFIGPLLIIFVLLVSIVSFTSLSSLSLKEADTYISSLSLTSAADNGFISALLYVGLIIPGLASFLPMLSASKQEGTSVRFGPLLGMFLFFVTLAIVALALMLNIETVHQAMVPSLALSGEVLPNIESLFSLIIFVAIYSSGTPLLIAALLYFAKDNSPTFKWSVVVSTAVCYFISLNFSFAELLNIIYPTIGYMGALIFLFIVASDAKLFLKKLKENKN